MVFKLKRSTRKGRSYFGIKAAVMALEVTMKTRKNEKGQGVMEYLILTSLIGIVCIVAVKDFGQVIRERIKDVQQEIVKNIRSK